MRVVGSYTAWPPTTIPDDGPDLDEAERAYWQDLWTELAPRYRLFRVQTLEGSMVMMFRYVQTCGWLPSAA